MQKHYYTDEKNAQIVIALLKAHGIRKVIANPGTTNIAFVGSVQNDPWFQVFSGVDERHSSYMAVGMAAESGEPVVLSCTGATASRNYLSALTEAYYRKLPILALTSIHHMNSVGNLLPQMLDRRVQMNDVVRYSLQCPVPHTAADERDCVSNVNKAILELTRHGGGPVHINLETDRVSTFGTVELPAYRVIHRTTLASVEWPKIEPDVKIVVWIGSHRPFSEAATKLLERFVETRSAVVLIDHTSNYRGKGAINSALLLSQPAREEFYPGLMPDLLIQIGEITGDYSSFGPGYSAKEVWRVSEDGEARDLFNKLSEVFEMSEENFFAHYAKANDASPSEYFVRWQKADADVRSKMPDLPFSNFSISKVLHDKIPSGSRMHFGILNSLRSWNFQTLPKGVYGSSNVGGFGIDGCVSALIGASLVRPEQLFFGIIGDLAFFYDLNSLGNRHIGKNLRILLVNNGCGTEFNLYCHYGSQFGVKTNDFIAAGRHNGNRSRELVKHYATDLGFKYLVAESQEQFDAVVDEFVDPISERSIVLECFTEPTDESEALYRICHIVTHIPTIKDTIKAAIPCGVKEIIKGLVK